MKLSVEVFLCYSDVLLNCLKQETSLKDKQLSKRDHYKVWTYTPEGQKESLFASLFFQETFDNKYFYRKVLELENGKSKHGVIDNKLFLKTAAFIGLQYPNSAEVDQLAPFSDLRCEVLLQVFLMQYMPEYWQAHKRQYQIFDVKTGEHVSVNQKQSGLLPDPEAQKAKNAIMDYFDAVSSYDYETAWDILDQNMKVRIWKNSFESFKQGYINTLKISQIHIWGFSPSAKSYSCKVFYMDKVALNHSSDQLSIAKMTLGEIDHFAEAVKKILILADENGIQGLRDLELFKIQERTFAEYARYKCQIEVDTLEKIFPRKESESIARLYEVVCSKNGHGYKIRSITPIKGINLR